MLRFKYKMSDDLHRLVSSTIIDYSSDTLYGACDEGYIGSLKHVSLYLVCHFELLSNGQQLFKSPLAIVARNESDAVGYYYQLTNDKDCTVLCNIEYDCSKIKVEPIQ